VGYTLIHYRQYYVGQSIDALLKHSLPGILALALLASEWLNGELRVNLALTLVSLGAALYVAESLALFGDPTGRRFIAARMSSSRTTLTGIRPDIGLQRRSCGSSSCQFNDLAPFD
jgi:hypothetical protein